MSSNTSPDVDDSEIEIEDYFAAYIRADQRHGWIYQNVAGHA